MIEIEGLPEQEAQLVERLVKQIKAHRTNNELRTQLMDSKHLLEQMAFVSNQKQLQAVLGWPAKAVETLARRCRLERFAVEGGELDAFGLTELLSHRNFIRRARQGELSSLVHGVAFEVVSRGGDGESPVVVTHTSALNGTGDYNSRRGRLLNFLSVSEWTKGMGRPTRFTLHQPGVVWTVTDGKATPSEHTAIKDRVLVEPLVYKPRLDRPLGSSRITRPVIFLTQSAVRVVVRSEATADLYSAPSLIATGLTADQIQDGSWRQGIGNVIGIPDADEGPDGAPNLARVTLEKIQQASQEPHVAQLRAWAQLFAGETSIPVSSLGISIDSNPTSAESYAASREDLIAEAEDANAEWGGAHTRTALNGWALANGKHPDDAPDELRTISARYRSPANTSRAAAADAFVKLATAIPGLAQTDSAIDLLGLDPDVAAKLRSDLRRARATAMLTELGRVSDGNA